MNTYYFPYGDMKGINKNIYEKFRKTCQLNEDHIIINLTKEYLHKYDNIDKMIEERTELIENIKTYLMDIKWADDTIHSFYDSIVEYIIENQSFISENEIYILFQYISLEKMFDLILYSKPFKTNLFEKIYQTLLSNSFIVSYIKYGYINLENIEKIVYPYYVLIQRLQNENIILDFLSLQMINDITNCKLNNDDPLYILIFNNLINYMKMNIKK